MKLYRGICLNVCCHFSHEFVKITVFLFIFLFVMVLFLSIIFKRDFSSLKEVKLTALRPTELPNTYWMQFISFS